MKHAISIYILVIGLCLQNPVGVRAATTDEAFRIPSAHHIFSFPHDYGSHPEFRIEWWYLTGQFAAPAGDRYGFQATFFRYAFQPGAGAGSDAFGTNHLFMAHMALTDETRERFVHEERFNRDGWDAFAAVGDLDLRNGNWTLRRTEGETMELSASIGVDTRMNLIFTPAKPKVFFGENGLSKKGADASACSWYITYPRLITEGQLGLDGKTIDVSGEAWMDHEISSSQLSRDQVGWDWLSVRFEDQSELMLYILRDAAGRPDPFSTLAWVTKEGDVHQSGPENFSWEVLDTWTSPETGATYPVHVKLSGRRPDGSPFMITVRPWMEAQELHGKLGGISYWEGACDILEDGRVTGKAYMELTGYANELGAALQ
ncbi:MAG: hypothetical protein KJN98_04315 [Pontiella sp.]|nr:hypothetical protein [Pontiella sp.]